MKLIVQRVSKTELSVDGKMRANIGKGFLILLGIKDGDTTKEADVLAEKISKLRIMSDADGKMNLSIKNAGGEILVVSQFTLYADTKGGNRPSFIQAARPEIAEPLYEYFVEKLRGYDLKVATGQFGSYMKIESVLDGPTTILMEY